MASRAKPQQRTVAKAAVHFFAVHEIVIDLCEIPPSRRTPEVARFVLEEMQRFCATTEHMAKIIPNREGDEWFFPRAAVTKWLATCGRKRLWTLAMSQRT